MAVTAAPGGAVRPVRVRHFLRLKLRIVASGLRGRPLRIVGFVLASCWALVLAVLGGAAFLGSALLTADRGLVLVTFLSAVLVLGWLLLPLLFFGVDETLDPARFALLPLPRRTLARGILGAAFVGPPAIATVLAFLGAAVAGGLRAGVVGAVLGTLGAALTVLLCVLVSRAVTSAFAAMLRSRRVRDLAAVLIALLAALIGPAQLAASSVARHASLGPALRAARTLAWTPLAAGVVVPFDLAAGRPLLAGARLAILVGTLGLLLWWWSRTLESAMLGGSGTGAIGAAVRGGPVSSLLPRLLRSGRPTRFTAMVARDLRYWSRDPRRRAGLISITIGGAVVPVALRLFAAPHPGLGPPLALAVAFPAVMGAALLANQFGLDGTAFSAQLLTAVPGRTELRARAAALSVIMVPLLVVVMLVVGVLSRAGGQMIGALGTLAAGFGASMGVVSVISVRAAYPVPEGGSPLAVNTGTGTVKGLFSLVGLLGSAALTVPVVLLALLPAPWSALALPAGVLWGLGAVLLGTLIGGDLLDRRGPEVLLAVTPRR